MGIPETMVCRIVVFMFFFRFLLWERSYFCVHLGSSELGIRLGAPHLTLLLKLHGFVFAWSGYRCTAEMPMYRPLQKEGSHLLGTLVWSDFGMKHMQDVT